MQFLMRRKVGQCIGVRAQPTMNLLHVPVFMLYRPRMEKFSMNILQGIREIVVKLRRIRGKKLVTKGQIN